MCHTILESSHRDGCNGYRCALWTRHPTQPTRIQKRIQFLAAIDVSSFITAVRIIVLGELMMMTATTTMMAMIMTEAMTMTMMTMMT